MPMPDEIVGLLRSKITFKWSDGHETVLRLGSEFVPRLSEGSIVLNTVRLASISLEESLEYGTRIEAILKLGRYGWNAARPGDQKAADAYVKAMADDPDPVIRTAATAARDLTLLQYRSLR